LFKTHFATRLFDERVKGGLDSR